jgi:hypothetical protein
MFRRGFRVKQGVPLERLIEMVTEYAEPTPDEISSSTENRERLERHLKARYGKQFSQLPQVCRGTLTQGQCTKHHCTEGRRLLCFVENRSKML